MPGQSTVPTIWVAPVRSHCTPITISWFAPAGARLPRSAVTPTRAVNRTISRLRMGRLPFLAYSVREWPDPEVVADVPPESVEPLGLHDEEEDDERPEQHEAQVGDEVEHGLRLEEQAAERLHGDPDHDRQQGHEGGAEDGPQHRAEPADDDHREVVDRHVDL